jgi:hypothetical protein
MIKYIVETTSAWRKTNGYSSHFARITSTKTKRSLVIDNVGGRDNAASLLFHLGVITDWSEVYETQHFEDSVREFDRKAKYASQGLYEHNVTAAMIRKLNRKA